MSFPSHENPAENPTSNAAPLLTNRSASNFYVTPMGKGRPAKMSSKHQESEEDPVAGMGFSIMGSIIGGALGLGPMFEIAFEAIKTGLEISEGQDGSATVLTDVNLNPAALNRPDMAFNFKSMTNGAPTPGRPSATQGYVSPVAKLDDESDDKKNKRTWNSGEGDFMLAARLASKRNSAVSTNPVMPMKGFGAGSSGRRSG